MFINICEVEKKILNFFKNLFCISMVSKHEGKNVSMFTNSLKVFTVFLKSPFQDREYTVYN